MRILHFQNHYFPKSILSLFGFQITDTLLSAFLLTLLFLIFFLFLTYKFDLKSKKGLIAMLMYDTSRFLGYLAMGERVDQHMAFLAALLFYIFCANVLPFFPIPCLLFQNNNWILTEFKSPTLDLNATMALGVAVFFYINYTAIKIKGLKGYLKSFGQPLIFLFPLHIIEEVARPFSLAMRLFVNIFSGAIILSLVYDYIPFAASMFHVYFDIFAGLIQSVVFVALTFVYMSFATEQHTHEERKL